MEHAIHVKLAGNIMQMLNAVTGKTHVILAKF